MQLCFTKALIIVLLTQTLLFVYLRVIHSRISIQIFISHSSLQSVLQHLSRNLCRTCTQQRIIEKIKHCHCTGRYSYHILTETRAIWQKEGSRLSCRKDFSLPQHVAVHPRMQCTKVLTSIINSLSIRMIICWTTASSLQHLVLRHAIPPQSSQQQLDADKQDSDWCHTPSQW